MISIDKIMERDFPRLSLTYCVESAILMMEKSKNAYLPVEKAGKIKGMITKKGLAGYPVSRLIMDCAIEPIANASEHILVDEALRLLEEKEVKFIIAFNGKGIVSGIINREIISIHLCEELKKLNAEKEKFITELKQAEELLRSQEDERRILSAEIHDELGVAITSLRLNCSMIKELVSLKKYDKIESFIDLIVDTSKELSSELRKVFYNLAPANISQDGIIYAISDYIEKIKTYAELEIDLKISREIENSDIVIKTTLYRTIQEAVTNAIRHSHAKNLMLKITKRKHDINLKIADNGIGFDMDSIEIDKYGLKGIHNRIENLGGGFKIYSKPGKGTSIEVQLPYI